MHVGPLVRLRAQAYGGVLVPVAREDDDVGHVLRCVSDGRERGCTAGAHLHHLKQTLALVAVRAP
jgi:hypothetical protein